jgi:hypothetical protein
MSSPFLKNGSSQRVPDIMYNLRGLNMVAPDQILDDSDRTRGQSPYAINSRMYAQDTEPRTTINSRKGPGFYTVPVGEALDVQNTTTTGQTDQNISYLNRVAQRFTPTASKRITKVDLLLKNATSNDTILVAIYEDSSGNLGNLLAISSIQRQNVQDTYTYTSVRFPQAPLVSSASNYWLVIYAQDESITTNYAMSRTTTGANLMASVDGGTIWAVTTGSVNYKVYQSDDAPVLWHCRYVKNDGTKQTIFAVGGATPAVYKVDNESTGAVSTIATGLSTSATRYRHAIVAGILYIVNGYDAVIKWNGTVVSRLVHDSSLFPVPMNIVLHKNRVYYYNKDNPTRVYFSELAPDYDTITSTNFFYVPNPTSPDPISGWAVFQDQLIIFKKESKWQLVGSDLSSFSLNQAPGGFKGAVSQEAIAAGESRLYFWNGDDGPNYYDGARDVAIGDLIQPEVKYITSPELIDTVLTDREWRVYFKRLGDSQHQRMFLFDIRYREWFLDTNTYTRLPVVRSLEANELMEASSCVGALYFGEFDYATLGAPIDWKYWTNYKKYGSGIAKDRVRTFRAIFESPNRTFTVLVGKDSDFDNSATMKSVILQTSGIVYDGGETYGSPTAIYGRGTRVSDPKVSLSGRAKNTQYRFEKYGAYTPVRLYGYESIIKSGRPR